MGVKSNIKLNMDDLESRHQEITVLYDYAEELIATVESDFVANAEAQLALLEPLVNEIGDAADILSEEFIHLAEGNQKGNGMGKARKARIEGALRRMYVSLVDYREKVSAGSKKARAALANIADPIVNKVQRQIEKIVCVFLEFVHLSLDRIMNKTELEQLKIREANVALMMHQWATQQQG